MMIMKVVVIKVKIGMVVDRILYESTNGILWSERPQA